MTDQWRSKKPIAIKQEIKQEAKHLMQEFSYFTKGVRCLFLLQRHKEGGETNNSKLRKIVTRTPKEFQDGLEELLTTLQESELPLRIYSCVNERDFDKAIHKFKQEQLDADLFHNEQKQNFYLDIRNRFVGCLMQPTQKATSYFLWDVDTKDDMPFLNVLPEEVVIILKYPTKKGWHIITEPFNYTKMVLPPDVELQKDGLLLIKWCKI